jgi:predicted transcriptional regulator YheO
VSATHTAGVSGGPPTQRPASHDAVFDSLRSVIDGISRTFGGNCEVVLHDFADPEHSIVAIAGNITRRKVGGSVTQIGLSLVAQGDEAPDQIGYATQTRDGKVLKSSTLLLRDERRHVFGAICINLDVTEFREVTRRLHQLVGPVLAAPSAVHFTDDITEVLRAVINEEEAAIGVLLDPTRKEDRLRIVAALKRRGAFAVQRAVPFVAEYLNVSRATVYAYLDEIRRQADTGAVAASAAVVDRVTS